MNTLEIIDIKEAISNNNEKQIMISVIQNGREIEFVVNSNGITKILEPAI